DQEQRGFVGHGLHHRENTSGVQFVSPLSADFVYCLAGLYHQKPDVPTKERFCSVGLTRSFRNPGHLRDFRRFSSIWRGKLSLTPHTGRQDDEARKACGSWSGICSPISAFPDKFLPDSPVYQPESRSS